MKVLLLTTRYHGPGGVEAYGQLLARALAEGGVQVDVLSLLSGDSPDAPCPGRYLGDLGARPTLWTKLRFAGRALRCGRGYDLVVCAHVAVSPLAMVLWGLSRVPYIVIAHGTDVWASLGLLRRMALRAAGRVVAASYVTARAVVVQQGVPRGRVTVVHPAVRPALLEAARDPRARAPGGPVTLLTVARLSSQAHHKGCETVIRALSAAARRYPDLRYVIVGDGDDRPRLEALARELGVASRVTFCGHLPLEELARQYGACDVYVMPSVVLRRSRQVMGEGFGIAFLEAAAFGRAAVAGREGGAAEAIEDGITGILVDGRRPEAVAAAIVALAEDEALRSRMGRAGYERVRRMFGFDRFRREIRGVTAEVLSARPARSASSRRRATAPWSRPGWPGEVLAGAASGGLAALVGVQVLAITHAEFPRLVSVVGSAVAAGVVAGLACACWPGAMRRRQQVFLVAGLALVTCLSVAAALLPAPATHLGPALRPVSLFATPIRQVAALVGVGGYRPLRFHPHHVAMATVVRYIVVVLVSLLTPRWAYRRRVA